MSSSHLAGAVRRIEATAQQRLATQPLVEELAEELRTTLSADALMLAATDPHTLLGLGAGVVHGMPRSMCAPFWEYEFEVPDFNQFCELARAPRNVSDLHAATGGRPQRSARYREMRTHFDADSELRATFNAGNRGWGLLHVNRAGTSGGFSEDEVEFVATIAPIVGRALRLSLTSHPAGGSAGCAPGMAIVDAANRVVSVTPEALDWFERIETIYPMPDADLGCDVPSEVLMVAVEARARGREASRTRVLTRDGVWLLVHASCLSGADANVAVVIEPAKASEVATLIVEAYELTPREVDVSRGLARGLSTNEIAGELHLSRYTVQDHLKAIYEKTGVSSRGELVAKVFADHYHEALVEAVHSASTFPAPV